jgi:Ca2+-binding RTX toxin-like protein
MFNFRTFARSRDPEEGRYVATSLEAVSLTPERLVFESPVAGGPFRDRLLTLTYEGDFALEGDDVFGEIAKVSLSIDGLTHFEIVPSEPIDVDEFDDFLDDVADLIEELEDDDEDEDGDDDGNGDDEDEDDDDLDGDDDEDDGDDGDDEDDDDEDDGDDDENDSDEDDDGDDEGAEIDDLADLDAVNDVLEALWDAGFVLRGSREDDDIEGDEGDDRLDGGRGDDDLGGGRGDDDLAGGAGRDSLKGGRGADTLDGGDGADTLDGGRGADVFVFVDLGDLGRGRSSDVVRAFDRRDVIDLSEIDAKEGRKGDQDFRFLEGDDFSGRSGELRFDGDALRGDVDGDGRSDFEIRIARGSLDADDLLL